MGAVSLVGTGSLVTVGLKTPRIVVVAPVIVVQSMVKSMLRKKWQQAEKRIGKVRPASGARWYAKGDVVTPAGELAQVKSTTTKAYRLTLKELEQIEEQALGEDRDALFVIEFQTPHGLKHYSVQRYYPKKGK